MLEARQPIYGTLRFLGRDGNPGQGIDVGTESRYRGYVDDSAKPAERKTTGLINALGSLTDGREVELADTRAFGCTIKWKS